MLLRVNSEINGNETDLTTITQGPEVDSGVPQGNLLSQLVDTTLKPTEYPPEAAVQVRQDICDAIGAEALVDASAIVGNFQRMVRIADGTGIPLDKQVAVISADLREELGYNKFGSANLTPKVGWFARWMGRKVAPMFIKRMARAAPAPGTEQR